MKRLIFLTLLIFAALIGNGQDKTGYIKTGQTALDKPMAFVATNYVEADDTFRIDITSEQVYPTKQNMYATLTDVSGSPSVDIKLFGKCFAGDAYVQIGSTVTWTSTANNPVNISATTPNQYRYYQALFIASSATQRVKISSFDLKIWFTSGLASSGTLTDGTMTANSGALTGVTTIAASGRITGTEGATLTGAATNINASSNFATNINTGTTTAALSLGGGSGTVAVNSSAWDITTAGVATGLTGVTVTADADNVVIDPYQDLHVLDVQVNSASKFSVDSTGAVVAAGAMTMTGGYTFTNVSPVIWAKGGSTVLATSGTDKACSNGARWWVEVDIPYNVTLTGIAYLVGSVGGTDSVVVQLHNSAGVEVATSKKTGANHGAIVGTAAQFQSCPFYVGASATPYAAVAGKYYVSVQFNGTNAKFRTYPIPGSKFITGTVAGTWDTKADITPGTSFSADSGPIVMTY